MAAFALILFGIFVVLAGPVRGLIQRRRTGETGFRGDATRASSISSIGGVLVAVGAPVADLTGSVTPIRPLGYSAVAYLGIGLAILGIAGLFAAQLAMGASWRIGVDTAEHTPLVTTGPFRLVRNPIFTAEAVAFGGFGLMVPNAIAMVGYAIVIAGIHYQVRKVEEPHLRRSHGAAYDDYTTRVGRFLPGVGTWRQSE
jgi:protein-S-isoprenylcysteine O-methyltransferase Ste14